MNLESLKQRLHDVETAMQNFVSQHNILAGQKTEIMHWIGELEAKGEAVVEKKIDDVIEGVVAKVL